VTNIAPEKWAKLRVAMAGLATMREIETHWTINDLADANEALDIKDEAEQFYIDLNRPKK
jgi:hypothetical protein